MDDAIRRVAVRRLRPDGSSEAAERTLAVEAPVAVSYNGIGYAVMMMTPADLDDFALGFSLSERIALAPAELLEVTAQDIGGGWLLDIRVPDARLAMVVERARARVSESSCGLCGLDSLATVLRPLPRVPTGAPVAAEAMFAALAALADHQPLGRATGAAHAAAWAARDGSIRLVREDVGRHSAFDKLIGAMARGGIDARDGFALLTSRCSYELVEKAATAGIATLVTISAATSLAVDRAAEAGIALHHLARADSMLASAPSRAEIPEVENGAAGAD